MNPKDRLHGSAVFLFTKTLTDSIDLMQNPIFVNLKTFISYYLEFGLPEERKFPLDTPEHIKSAIHLFGHCPEDKKHELAKRIMKAAAKNGIEVDQKSQVYKYATQHAIEEKPVNEEVESLEEAKSSDIELSDEQLSLLKEDATYEVINAYKHVANNTSVIEESFAQANINGKEFQIYFNEAVDFILNERTAFSSQGFSNKFRSLLYKERIKNQKEQFVIYDYIRSRVGMIAHAYIDYQKYQKKNLFIDMAYYMNLFFKNNMFRLDTGVDLFIELASRSFHDSRLSAAGYNRKTVLVPLDKWCRSADLAWDYHKELNPVSAIVRMAQRKDLSLLKEKWGGMDFVFLTKTSYM